MYSLVARYHERMGYSSIRDTVLDLFGEVLCANVELPTRIGYLADQLPWQHLTTDEFIKNHTAAPYYSVFLMTGKRKKLVAALTGSKKPRASSVIGGLNRIVQAPAYLRFCNVCVTSDRERYGFAYWHRVHQLPGVVVCPIHNVMLQSSRIAFRLRRLNYAFTSLEETLPEKFTGQKNTNEKHLSIAKDSEWILSNFEQVPELQHFQIELQSRLKLIGWMTPGGNLRAKTVCTAWQQQYPRDFLAGLGCGIESITNPVPYLRSLIFGGRASAHPLFGLLATRLAGVNIEGLYALAKTRSEKSPITPVQARCINPVCPESKTSRWVCTKPLESSRDRISVSCSACGMEYTQIKNFPGIPKVVVRGMLWENRLRSMVESNTSQYEIARHLEVDRQTVKRVAAKMGIHTDWKPLRPGKASVGVDIVFRNKQRKQYEVLINNNKNATRTQLRELAPSCWRWLLRNDAAWLERHAPIKQPRSRGLGLVDLKEHDRQLCLKLEKSVRQILESKEKPVQISQTELARRVGIRYLFNKSYIQHYPKAKKLAAKKIESRQQFATRRIRWCVDQYNTENIIPSRWEFVRRAGLRPDMEARCEKIIQAALSQF